jgi:hypothetical protein
MSIAVICSNKNISLEQLPVPSTSSPSLEGRFFNP